MKKLLTLALGVVAMLTSCQKAETGVSPQTNEVTFNLAVDNTTRSGGDTPTRYIMEIYTDISSAYDSRVEQATGSFTVMLKEDEEYDILFYADYGTPQGNENEYDAASLKALQVEKQPTKACFAGSVNFTYDSQATDLEKTYLNPTLKHAVAQVNFVQGAEDFLEDGNSLTVTLPQTFSYNAATGEVSEIASTETTLSFTGIAKENSEMTIGQSYIFANPSAQTIMQGVTIQFNDEEEKSIDNVPFQANSKTNINGLYNNMYNSIFTAVSSADWEQDIDKPTVVTYAIGDTYPAGAAGDDILGVVYSISNGGANGLVVSLIEETNKTWDEAQTWATTHNAGGKTWKCPTKDELKLLYADTSYDDNISAPNSNTKTAVNTTLSGIGGTAQLSTSAYWSSTEADDYYAWNVDFYDGNADFDVKDYDYNSVRAVLAF